jgi:hypothetical protein
VRVAAQEKGRTIQRMATAALPLVVLIAGALLFALSSNGKVARMGELAFFVGLFWLVGVLASTKLHLM